MSNYQRHLTLFAVLIVLLEIFIMFMFGFYVRHEVQDLEAGYLEGYYPWFQDVNVMILIGFGFLMSFIRSKAWSALGFTFFTNAIVFQLYILWEGFWHKVFHDGFEEERYIRLDIVILIKASFCVGSVLIAFGAMIGRMGPLELLILGVVMSIGFTLNEAIIFDVLKAFDIGGSMGIHAFGAYCGLACSAIIGLRMQPGKRTPIPSYLSCIFAMMGTLFLWIYWPSFNSAMFQSALQYQRMIIINNTVLSLTGSCLSAFACSVFFRRKLCMDDVLNATIAGGVAVGSSASFITNPAGAIAIGCLAGAVSAAGYYYLSDILTDWGVYDTCGVNNLHGMPGLIGGLSSAVFVAAYNSTSLNIAGGNPLDFADENYLKQGGIQVAATFVSLGIGLATGAVAGLLIYPFYSMKTEEFFDDNHYWEIHHHKHLEPAPYYVVAGQTEEGVGEAVVREPQVFPGGRVLPTLQAGRHPYLISPATLSLARLS